MAAPQVPAFLQQFRNKDLDAEARAGITSFARPPHISIDNNRFHIVGAGVDEVTDLEDFAIEVVVVGANKGRSKIYYDKPYDPKAADNSPPTCYSDNGIAPSVNASEPQNATCDGCSKSFWGSQTSKVSGKGIPACQDRKKLVVLFDGLLYQLIIPPNSLSIWQKYAKEIADHPQLSLNIVRTRVTFDPKVQGTLNFMPLGFATVDGKGPAANLTGFTSQEDYGKFATQLQAKGPTMLDTFTGNDDKPRLTQIEGPKKLDTNPNQGRFSTGPEERDLPLPKEVATGEVNARGAILKNGGNGGFMQTDEAPAQKKPPKKKEQPAPFGMIDAGTTDEPEIEDAVAKAMGFLDE